MGRVVRLAGNVLFGLVAAGIALTILGLTVLPPILHYQSFVVLSGSMEPSLHVGSVIVATAVDPNSLQIGDVITYQPPGAADSITHRIVQIKGSAQGKTFVTQGDANNTPDVGDVRYDRLAGKVRFSIPYIGYAFKFIGSPTMRYLFIVVPGMLLLGSWLWEIWRPEPKPKTPDAELPAGIAPAPNPAAKLTKAQERKLGVAADAAAVPLRQ